ncbi:MAG: 50S ribosomal protein L11 methyltransferase [Planctomycetes bacterium]|nr:50S ribosomal protein L11 methyltransferase [Planctomycetota bacterium]
MSARRIASSLLALALGAACAGGPQEPSPPEPRPARVQQATPETGGAKLDDALAAATKANDEAEVRRLLALAASTPSEEEIDYASAHLGITMRLLPTVFPPQEAELFVLPFVADHAAFFAGKTVMEIGTGSGIISLYCAKLGAKKVVATDINPWAIESLKRNAARLGVADRVEGRLVTVDDMSAYAVIGADERFDILISNPPYNLDLDSTVNTPEIDKGDLGFSLLRGLDAHLSPDGMAVLFYNSLFYHQLIVKLARYLGFEVRTHNALGISPWEFEALFNLYLGRVLERERLPKDAFRFDDVTDLLPYALTIEQRQFEPQANPLIDGFATGKLYRGFLTIARRR